MVFLSLFDGTGVARAGVGDLLRVARAPRVLASSDVAESGDDLAGAVERRRRSAERLGFAAPQARFASNAWDLFGNRVAPLRGMLEGTLQDALVLVIG
eukprot:4474749-Lingulodinium_polyedra.AAC.1